MLGKSSTLGPPQLILPRKTSGFEGVSSTSHLFCDGVGMDEYGGGTKGGGVSPGDRANVSFSVYAGGCGGREVINAALPL
jgi:hypothetical protein